MIPRWRVDEERGAPADLHAGSADLVASYRSAPVNRAVRVLTSTERAVALGRAQPETTVDRDRAADLGIAVVRRASGGGAVLVGPGECVWVDVVVPAGDPLWDDDVGRACWWLGDVWADALAAVGLPGRQVWRQAMVRTTWSDRVCFAGLAAGEVTSEGRKLVGISQRRTGGGALFQCAVPVNWDPAPLIDVLRWGPGERERAAAELPGVAVGIGDQAADSLVPVFLDRLGACSAA